MSGAPIELLAVDDPHPGVIRARREGEPSFSQVQDIGDAYQAATARGVHVVMTQQLIDQLRAAGDLPTELPEWIEVRSDL
jgi:hypothetical protein